MVDRYLRAHRFSGAVLIAQRGEVLLHRGYGLADIEAGRPNTAETVFPIMSITKPFTAIAVLQLQEQGRLDVHDPLTTSLPGFPDGDHITVHHLLAHRSGLPGELLPIPTEPAPVAAALAGYTGAPLGFAPGTGYGYSNLGYQILALIVEQHAGRPYADYLREAIFRPLGMAHTDVAIAPLRRTDLPVGYMRHDGDLVAVASFDDAAATRIGAGGIYSTTGDLYRWAQALRTDDLLSAESRAQLFRPYTEDAVYGVGGYGYSWAILEPRQAMWHTGGNPGFFALVFLEGERDIVVIGLSNDESDTPLLDALLRFYVQSAELERSGIVAALPAVAAGLVGGVAAWLLVTARRLRRGTRVVGRPRWWRLVLQGVLPVLAGLLVLTINLEPLWVIGSWRLTALVAPAWPPILAASVGLLMALLVVALHAFVRPTVAPAPPATATGHDPSVR